MLEFFDYYLIAFVLAFIVKPWQLTFGQSAIILRRPASAPSWARYLGPHRRRDGRRTVFMRRSEFLHRQRAAVLHPRQWLDLSFVMRFFVGFGVGGLYCVDLPLVQEFVPARMRGFIGGLVTVFIPLGVMISSSLAAFFSDSLVGAACFSSVCFRPLYAGDEGWVPESPHWLMTQGRREEARRSVAWALRVAPESLPCPRTLRNRTPPRGANCSNIREPGRIVDGQHRMQTASYGIGLWAPTLFVLQLGSRQPTRHICFCGSNSREYSDASPSHGFQTSWDGGAREYCAVSGNRLHILAGFGHNT